MATQAQGEYGGSLFDGKPSQVVQLIERAERQGWNIPDAALKLIPAFLANVVADRDLHGNPIKVSIRTKIRASQALDKMLNTNLKADPPPQEVNHTVKLTDEQRQQHLRAIYTELFGVPPEMVDGAGPADLRTFPDQLGEPNVRPDDPNAAPGGISAA